jgi:hypothetical protein
MHSGIIWGGPSRATKLLREGETSEIRQLRKSSGRSAFLPRTTDEREVALMRVIVTTLIILASIAAISLFGFSGVVTPIATAAIWFVPATFAVSLVIGFASRRRTWFG